MKNQTTVREKVVTETGIFTQIRQIFLGTVLETKHEPGDKKSEVEKELGVLTDPAAKAVYSLHLEMINEANKEIAEHNALHASGQIHGEESCKVLQEKIARISSGAETLSNLFWAMVYPCFPGYISYGIRQGWVVVNLRSEVAEDLFFDKEHPSSTFMEDVRRVLVEDESKLSFVESEFDPIDMEAEECKIGEVKSVRAKALFSINNGLDKSLTECLEQAMCRVIPIGKTKTQIIVEAKNKALRLREQSGIVKSLFWLALEEEVPAMATDGNFGIRKNWAVVRIPKEDPEDMLDYAISRLVSQILVRRYGC